MIHPYELIDGGLYKVGATVVRYCVTTNNFYRLDGKILGFLTQFQKTHEMGCRVGTPKEPLCYVWKNEHINGIPITPEILEKNGFRYEHNYGSYYRSILGDYAKEKEPTVCIGWNSKGEMCEWDIADGNRGASYGKRVISVHELQHLLRLCGPNELAENFKVI